MDELMDDSVVVFVEEMDGCWMMDHGRYYRRHERFS